VKIAHLDLCCCSGLAIHILLKANLGLAYMLILSRIRTSSVILNVVRATEENDCVKWRVDIVQLMFSDDKIESTRLT
jgi:hypothetical protein